MRKTQLSTPSTARQTLKYQNHSKTTSMDRRLHASTPTTAKPTLKHQNHSKKKRRWIARPNPQLQALQGQLTNTKDTPKKLDGSQTPLLNSNHCKANSQTPKPLQKKSRGIANPNPPLQPLQNQFTNTKTTPTQKIASMDRKAHSSTPTAARPTHKQQNHSNKKTSKFDPKPQSSTPTIANISGSTATKQKPQNTYMTTNFLLKTQTVLNPSLPQILPQTNTDPE